MNSIEAMESEIHLQLESLTNFQLLEPDKKCLFVGSGDSYAASLAAQFASGNKALCCYPLDLVANPSIANGRVVYLVSISGKTKANLLAARAAKITGSRTVAVTAKPDSPLAASCDDVIELKYSHGSVATAGTISFTSSLLTCLSLAAKINVPRNLNALFALAEKQASTFVSSRKSAIDSYFILGTGFLFPIAMYGALKINEIMGRKALAYPTEEFCHSPIFSICRNDAIVMLKRGNDSAALHRRLGGEGYSSLLVRIRSEDMLQSILHSTFFVQLFALKMAQRMKLKECYFFQNKPLLRVSSDFIYG